MSISCYNDGPDNLASVNGRTSSAQDSVNVDVENVDKRRGLKFER